MLIDQQSLINKVALHDEIGNEETYYYSRNEGQLHHDLDLIFILLFQQLLNSHLLNLLLAVLLVLLVVVVDQTVLEGLVCGLFGHLIPAIVVAVAVILPARHDALWLLSVVRVVGLLSGRLIVIHDVSVRVDQFVLFVLFRALQSRNVFKFGQVVLIAEAQLRLVVEVSAFVVNVDARIHIERVDAVELL